MSTSRPRGSRDAPEAMTGTQRTITSADGAVIGYHTLGVGEGVIVVGGGLRTAEDYLPLASVLARRFQVHVIDRRGRGASAPQDEHYTIEKEYEDLSALQEQTGATRVFGHSYGGLIALETVNRTHAFTHLAVYEPGVSLGGSIPTAWMPRYRQMLEDGDTRGAFAYFVQRSGHAPGAIVKLPLWYLKTVMRFVVKKRQWQRLEPLLPSNLVEHEQLARLDITLSSYAAITARVLLLGGGNSPSFSTRPLHELDRILADSRVKVLAGLDHNAPDEKAPEPVGEGLLGFL